MYRPGSTERLAFAGVALCTLLVGTMSLLGGASGGTALSFVATTAGIGLLMMLLRDLRVRNQELIGARAEVARLAVADERERFTRDLHDLLGHTLSVIALKAELAGRLLPGAPERAADGLDAAAALRRELPSCRVLILTTFGRKGYLRRAMERGASGFLLKDAPAPELAAAIRRAVAGERIVEPGLAAAALSEGESPLTPREREVLAAAREYPTVAELAAAIHLSPRERSATTCPRRCTSSTRGTGPRPCGPPRSGVGCEGGGWCLGGGSGLGFAGCAEGRRGRSRGA